VKKRVSKIRQLFVFQTSHTDKHVSWSFGFEAGQEGGRIARVKPVGAKRRTPTELAAQCRKGWLGVFRTCEKEKANDPSGYHQQRLIQQQQQQEAEAKVAVAENFVCTGVELGVGTNYLPILCCKSKTASCVFANSIFYIH
jgi:hypothetical protein